MNYLTLRELLNEINRTYKTVKNQIQKTYEENGLIFNEKSLESISGDIHVKLLGKYIYKKLHYIPAFEKIFVPKRRFRADILFPGIAIEVKIHGMFGIAGLEKRFNEITRLCPEMTHIYIAFRERKDYIMKTKDVLDRFGVKSFFFSGYSDDVNKVDNTSSELEAFLECVKTSIF